MVGTFSSTDLNFDGHTVSSASYNAMFVARTKP